MAAVSSTTTNSAADIFAAINGAGTKKETSVTADMENRFLTLLTTQLKNQDPLNPLDNAQVTSQLAQINTVNGIEKLNATMTKLLSAYDQTQAMQAAAMIGKHVLTAGNSLPMASGQAIGGVQLEGPADKVVVTIKNAAGTVVQATDLGAHEAGNFSFVWDGKNEKGELQADGNYTISVEATQDGKKVKSSALQIGIVNAVTRAGNGYVLDLGIRGQVKFEDVQQIL